VGVILIETVLNKIESAMPRLSKVMLKNGIFIGVAFICSTLCSNIFNSNTSVVFILSMVAAGMFYKSRLAKYLLIIGLAFFPIINNSFATKSYINNSQLIEGFSKDSRYAGILKKNKGFLWGLFKPKAKYQLVGSNGQRIFYVETQNMLLNKDIVKFINKKVVIFGKTRRKNGNIVISANSIYFD
jgi:hypothetical protein